MRLEFVSLNKVHHTIQLIITHTHSRVHGKNNIKVTESPLLTLNGANTCKTESVKSGI